jgi:catechol 2,3-dioxygenase-like lactoylglutathione lyase family enzyme
VHNPRDPKFSGATRRLSATMETSHPTQEVGMSTSQVSSNVAGGTASHGSIDMKLEVVTIPVSDIDRATEFYKRLGWRQDVTPPGSGVTQFTPPGSWCSVQFGVNRTTAAPGSAQGLFLIVTDIDAAREQLVASGVEVGDVFHNGPDGRVSGPDPEHGSYRSFASLSDPDGNKWLFQEITSRLPGRVDASVTSFGSTRDLAEAMRRASAAHGEHEKRIGKADPDWPDWYAAYMVAEQAGTDLPK